MIQARWNTLLLLRLLALSQLNQRLLEYPLLLGFYAHLALQIKYVLNWHDPSQMAASLAS